VSAHSIPKLFTVEEYEEIPNPPGGRYELHHGELVFVTFPGLLHKALQRRLRRLLEPAAESNGFLVDSEYPYRQFPKARFGERTSSACGRSVSASATSA
jgi:hypothetical protein